MIITFAKQLLSMTLSLLLVITTVPSDVGAQEQASAPSASSGYSGQGAPLSAEDLQQLVAPIALYPDALVAQVLGAATFPDQVAFAVSWLQQNSSLTGKKLMKAVDAQSWDPSVKALTQFPSVLANLATNLSWTSALGEAYHTQAADVMGAVQFLRAKALAADNLKSSPQLTVVQQSPQVIVIQSANPQVVYVPVYNPTVVYGYPYVTPGYSASTVAAAAVISFGAGVAVGAMMSSGCCGWGYSSWNCGWHGTTAVVYRGGAYYGNSAWHGGYYGTAGYGGVSHYGTSYNPSTGTYARGGTVSNGYASVSAGTAYNPSTGTYTHGASVSTPQGSVTAGTAYNPSTGTYARGASVSTPYGTQSAAQAYNPRTGTYGATEKGSNANGSWGSSTLSQNGNTAYSQHQTTPQGTTGSIQTSNGGSAYGASGKYGNNSAVGQTANGNKYATANGNTYNNAGSGSPNTSGSSSKYSGSNSNSAASKGWGEQGKSGGSSAFRGSSGGWGAKSESSRGWSSRGGGGGWGGRR